MNPRIALTSMIECLVSDCFQFLGHLAHNQLLGEQCNSSDELCTAEDRQKLCNILPPSIESLWIQRCGNKILPHMRELATLKAKKFPHLNDIMLEIGKRKFEEIMGYFSHEEGKEDLLVMERIARDFDSHHYWLEDWNHPA
jgi:hypothetical protein